MKHKRFSDEQVIGVFKEHGAGAKVDDICQRHAISTATFYTWRKKNAAAWRRATRSGCASSRPRIGSSSGSSNRKRTYRLYTEEGLQVRTKKRRKLSRRDRIAPQVPERPMQRWFDFVSDPLADCRRFRMLNIVDDHSRFCPGQIVDVSISGARVARHLDDLASPQRAAPSRRRPKICCAEAGCPSARPTLSGRSARRTAGPARLGLQMPSAASISQLGHW